MWLKKSSSVEFTFKMQKNAAEMDTNNQCV